MRIPRPHRLAHHLKSERATLVKLRKQFSVFFLIHRAQLALNPEVLRRASLGTADIGELLLAVRPANGEIEHLPVNRETQRNRKFLTRFPLGTGIERHCNRTVALLK